MKEEKLLKTNSEKYNWFRFIGELLFVILISPILIILTICFLVVENCIKLYEKYIKKS